MTPRAAWRALHERPYWMVLLGLCALGCDQQQVSVGELPCADDEHVLCARHSAELLGPELLEIELAPESTAEVVWQRPIATTRPCTSSDCTTTVDAYLVDDDGEVTCAGTFRDTGNRELWVTRFAADGGPVFDTLVTGSGAALGDDTLTQVALTRDQDGSVLLVFGHGTGTNVATRGELEAYVIDRSGEVEPSFRVDTGKTWPGPIALLDSDVIVARTMLAPQVQIARYARGDELRWRQTEVAFIPADDELGLSFDEATNAQLFALDVDSRGRTWGILTEGVFGIVQLDPDGVVGWHGWMPWPAELNNTPTIVIDGHDRPVVGNGETVLRVEADGTDAERHMPRATFAAQENFYAATVDGLDVDRQDRIYVGTQDGPRSARRVLVDRIAEDFGTRERFVVQLAAADAQARGIRQLQVGANGDVYVQLRRIDGGLQGLGGTSTGSDQIARLHLTER